MLQGLFSVKEPDKNSNQFYKMFYSSYSLLQINDIVMNELLQRLSDSDKEEIMNNLVIDGSEVDRAYVYTVGMMLFDNSLDIRKNDKRGLDTSILEILNSKNIDSFKWYLQSNEYIQLYAVCEQAIKEFLIEKGIDVTNIRESTIMNKLFDIIGSNKDKFLNSMKENTNNFIEKQNDIINTWRYFTEIRHLYMHAGGRITTRFKNNMIQIENKFGEEMNKLEENIFLELMIHDIEKLFKYDFNDSIIFPMNLKFLNFFRNFMIILVESLDKV